MLSAFSGFHNHVIRDLLTNRYISPSRWFCHMSLLDAVCGFSTEAVYVLISMSAHECVCAVKSE